MAKTEHLDLLQQGVEVWNQWRHQNIRIMPDLRGADLRGADLRRFDLHGADLRGANLYRANLYRANLNAANLSNANLSNTRLLEATLSGALLFEADLSETLLCRAEILGTNFEKAVFTGACLENCNTNSATNFHGTFCDYVYLDEWQRERRPRKGIFQLGEFAALFQQAVDTIDLIFKDGIDWQAFFQSFQELRSQCADQDLSIQAVEKKRGGAFVVRLEVSEDADKQAIESRAKELYAIEIKALETQYVERFRLQGQHLEDARQTIEVERRDKATLMAVMSTMASTQQGPKYDMRGTQFAGGFAETVQGDQIGGIINNYGSNAEDITRLLTALRDQAQTFPTNQKDDANDTLDDLERDLAEEQPDQGRIGRRLKRLVAIATLITGLTAYV